MDINYLYHLQQFRGGPGSLLTSFLSKMTWWGELNTVVLLIAAVYWCVNKEYGEYLFLGWSGNRLMNGFLKVTACVYRPWIRDARIVPDETAIVTATGYSFPSGHTMNAATVFGGSAIRRELGRGLRILMWLMLFLVAFSRNFLGVHTPQDVLVGAAAGVLVMFLAGKLMSWLKEHPEKDVWVAVVGIGLAVLLAVYASLKTYPEDFDAEGQLIVDGAKMAMDTFKGIGYCCAFLTGWILERRFVRFHTDISMRGRVARFAGGMLSYYVISLILCPPLKEQIGGAAGTMISCFIQIFYVVFLFPLLFMFLEKRAGEAQGNAMSGGGQSR